MSQYTRDCDELPIELPARRSSLGNVEDIHTPRFLGLVLMLVLVAGLTAVVHPSLAESTEEWVRPRSEIEGNLRAKNDLKEVLWLARALYSETKDHDEQILVAWVVRNRFESTKYPDEYEKVVLEYAQFSGLHSGDDQYHINISREYDDTGKGWDSAVALAEEVYFADESERPIPDDVWHFYSPISASSVPEWTSGKEPFRSIIDAETGATRFAFYQGVK